MIDLIQIQKMVYERLSQLPYSVVDDYVLYQEVEPPFVQLSSLYIENDNTKNTDGLEVEQYINIYSTYKGKKEVLEISQEVSELMKEKMEYTTNYVDIENRMQEKIYSIYIEEDRKTIMMDMDGNGNKFYHAVLIFRLKIN